MFGAELPLFINRGRQFCTKLSASCCTKLSWYRPWVSNWQHWHVSRSCCCCSCVGFWELGRREGSRLFWSFVVLIDGKSGRFMRNVQYLRLDKMVSFMLAVCWVEAPVQGTQGDTRFPHAGSQGQRSCHLGSAARDAWLADAAAAAAAAAGSGAVWCL